MDILAPIEIFGWEEEEQIIISRIDKNLSLSWGLRPIALLDKIFFASKYILIKRELAKLFEIKISGTLVHWHRMLEAA